jgi:glycosyltransferase involved in cell wall biosynthesis
MPQLRVLHVTDCYDGGVLTSINNYVKSNPEVIHSLMYVNFGRAPDVQFARTYEFDSRSWVRRYLQYKRVDKSGAHDLVHVHSSRAGALTRVTKSKTPLVFQSHGISFAQPRHKVIQSILFWIEKYLAKNTDAFIAVSPNEKTQISRLTGSSSRVFIVKNFSEISGKRNSKRFVLMIGRVVDLKGPEFFSAVSQLDALSEEKVEFVWIGNGDKDLVAMLEDNGIVVTGWLGKKEIQAYLAQSLAYLHTSSSEGFPISLLDAANIGVPIIVRSIDAFDGYDILKISTSREAADAIQKIKADTAFEDLLIQMSHTLAEQHTLSEMRKSYLEVLESLNL